MLDGVTGCAVPSDRPTKVYGYCGVFAVATFTGQPFRKAWKTLAECQKRLTGAKRFGGRSCVAAQIIAMKQLTGLELVRMPHAGMTLATLARVLPPSEPFFVHTTGHVQVIYGGRVFDQNVPPEGAPITRDIWQGRKHVIAVYCKDKHEKVTVA